MIVVTFDPTAPGSATGFRNQVVADAALAIVRQLAALDDAMSALAAQIQQQPPQGQPQDPPSDGAALRDALRPFVRAALDASFAGTYFTEVGVFTERVLDAATSPAVGQGEPTVDKVAAVLDAARIAYGGTDFPAPPASFAQLVFDNLVASGVFGGSSQP